MNAALWLIYPAFDRRRSGNYREIDEARSYPHTL
jgi:hypothetical protein